VACGSPPPACRTAGAFVSLWFFEWSEWTGAAGGWSVQLNANSGPIREVELPSAGRPQNSVFSHFQNARADSMSSAPLAE